MESMSSSSSSIHSTSAASDVLSSSQSSATKKDVKTDNQALKILNQIRTKVAKVFIPKKSNSNKSKTSQKINLPQRVINSFVNEVKSVLKALNKKSEQFDEAINAYVHENFQIPGFESQEINEENDVGTTKSEESKTLDEGIIRDFTPRLKAAVENGKQEDFKNLMVELTTKGHKGEAAKCVQNLLDDSRAQALSHHVTGEYNQFVPFEGHNRDNYNNLTNFLSEIYGEKYSKFYRHVRGGGRKGLDTVGLNSEGAKEILNVLSAKGKIKMEYIMCKGTSFDEKHEKEVSKNQKLKYTPNPNVLDVQLNTKIKQMQKTEGAQKCVMMIESNGHFSPLYLEKNSEGKFNFVLTDSVGRNGPYVDPIINDINATLKKRGLAKNSQIYASNTQRQMDSSNCGIFSIRDVVKMANNSENLVQWIEANNSKNNSVGNLKKFDLLPPFMMKTVQSLNAAADYDEDIRENGGEATLNEKKYGENPPSLSKYLQEHTIKAAMPTRENIVIKDINSKIYSAFLKYENYLMAHLVTNEDIPT